MFHTLFQYIQDLFNSFTFNMAIDKLKFIRKKYEDHI